MPNANRKAWKKWVIGALALLLAADAALLVVLWREKRAAPQALRDRRVRLEQEANILSADVTRAESIRRRLPEVGKECDRFYAQQFLPTATGYSAVVADLGQIAGRAGLKTRGVLFKQADLKDRGITEVRISAAVEGDYPGIVHFINGLERSKNFYLLDRLSLAAATTGGIRLNLELRTFFRT